MSDSASAAPYGPGVYVKGDNVQVATSASNAVALVFNGYARQDESPAADADYRDLQAQAKELGIKANQSADALHEQIDAKLSEDPSLDLEAVSGPENPDAPVTGGDSPITGIDD